MVENNYAALRGEEGKVSTVQSDKGVFGDLKKVEVP
jgi:hypothetical protein